MSRHGADAVCFLCSDWLLHYFLEFDWLKTIANYQCFPNLDTCEVAMVKVSNETIQLIVHWAIRWSIL